MSKAITKNSVYVVFLAATSVFYFFTGIAQEPEGTERKRDEKPPSLVVCHRFSLAPQTPWLRLTGQAATPRAMPGREAADWRRGIAAPLLPGNANHFR